MFYGGYMKNITVAILIGASLIISSFLLSPYSASKNGIVKVPNQIGRYKILINSGVAGGLVTIKYDSITGKTWRLGFPENHWVEIKDYGRYYHEPKK